MRPLTSTRRLIIGLFFSLFFTISYSQDYEDLIQRAEDYYDQNEFELSGIYYDSAFINHLSPSYSNLYNAACSWSLAGDVPKSVSYLKEAFEKGYPDFDWMYYDKDLDNMRKDEAYLSIESTYRSDSTLYFFELIERLIKKDTDFFQVANYTISFGTEEPLGRIRGRLGNYSLEEICERAGITVNEFREKTKDLRILFFECKFSGDADYQLLRFFTIKELIFAGGTGNLVLDNIMVNRLEFIGGGFDNLVINESKVSEYFRISNSGNEFTIANSEITIDMPDRRPGIRFGEQEAVRIFNLTLNPPKQKTLNSFIISGDTRQFFFNNSTINYPFELALSVSNKNDISANEFNHLLDINFSNFPEFDNYIPFYQFDNGLYIIRDEEVFGDSISDYLELDLYNRHVNTYKLLYNSYRTRGDIESANASYRKIKEIEIDRLKIVPNLGFDQKMRLWINQLMGYYTDHGTNPGKAVVISIYIVLIFGVFYFFFPSEWDKRSKSQLISDYKLFIAKNEHGYTKPFLKMVSGFILSLINSLSLSLNAFVTLGFGSIPTKGLARYVCIIQGFLGWFLLSLFTVALINQVLL